MRDAAHKARILDFIEGLPDGFETLVGDNGIQLSGGQRQRVASTENYLKDLHYCFWTRQLVL